MPRPRTRLRMAAEELRYYIGELTGRPLHVVGPDQADDFTGTLYRIVDLKPLAATWEAMEANRQSGKFPASAVNVEREGREVIFKAWPYANVRFSVWAFLEKQGVRWLYPDDQGDYVPAGKGVSLDCLPLRYTPRGAVASPISTCPKKPPRTPTTRSTCSGGATATTPPGAALSGMPWAAGKCRPGRTEFRRGQEAPGRIH